MHPSARLALAAALIASATVLPACSLTPDQRVPEAVAPLAPSAPPRAADPVSFAYTGAAQKVTAPGGVTAMDVIIAGAEGGKGGKKGKVFGRAGRGVQLHLNIPVAQGSTLAIGVGGSGGVADGDHGPGSGGWGLDHAGGAGGRSKALAVDGSGGGGASVLKINDTVAVIAGGGGGQTTGDDADLVGGDAGLTQGQDAKGDRFNTAVNGLGGSSTRPDLRKDGEDAKSQTVKFAGAGGGGGYHNGGGGKVGGAMTGGSGGGGDSYVQTDATTVDDPVPHTGNGVVTITWIF